MDITAWLLWFLAALHRAIQHAHTTLDAVLAKAHFLATLCQHAIQPRHITLLNRLLDGFDGKLTTRRWASMANCSQTPRCATSTNWWHGACCSAWKAAGAAWGMG